MFRENAVLAEHVDSMTEAQIELLIEATKALNSPFELKFLTSLYIHRLAKNGIFIARKGTYLLYDYIYFIRLHLFYTTTFLYDNI